MSYYVFGRKFAVHTDHAPLVSLFNKCLNNTSPRLQQLLLRLSQYEMNIEYVTSKCVPVANCLSRLINAKSAQEDGTLNLQITDLGVEPVNRLGQYQEIHNARPHIGQTCKSDPEWMA